MLLVSVQFELLAALCSASTLIVNQSVNDLDNKQLVTVQLLSEYEVHSQVTSIAGLIRANMLVQAATTVDFLKITTRSNSLISALNTNIFVLRDALNRSVHYLITDSTSFFDKSATDTLSRFSSCQTKSSTTPAGIYSLSQYDSVNNHRYWPGLPPSFEPMASATINGFFGACNPLDAVLASTLDCVYDVTCLRSLTDYFPDLNRV